MHSLKNAAMVTVTFIENTLPCVVQSSLYKDPQDKFVLKFSQDTNINNDNC
jgi:hypothetical protein